MSSRSDHYCNGSVITDIIAIYGVRQSYVWYYGISYQTQYGTPQPFQTPWYGWNQWSDQSTNIAEFNDPWGYHHRQTTSVYGYGNGTCSGTFSYQGLLGWDETYAFNVYTY